MKKYFERINDPRQPWKTVYNLHEIVIMTICAVISGCDQWEDIVDFCEVKEALFREKLGLVLEHGIASHDTFQRIFQIINPLEMEASFVSWVQSIASKTKGEIVSIDGKTARSSGDSKSKAIHMVSAWASANQLALGQVKTDEKSNEITAIPTLIEMLELKGCIVTIDAMGCQKNITEKIIGAEADYVLALKKNHEKLYEAVENHFTSGVRVYANERTAESGHGRFEIREYYLETELNWLDVSHEWHGLKSVGMVKSCTFRNGKSCTETRFYITCLDSVEDFAYAVRNHWGIENSLHWCLDVVFREDSNRTRKDNSAENFAVISRLALNVLKQYPVKMSLARKRRKCHYDADFMADVLLSVF
jgi:predicted transposase YbfD/YdcC